MFSIYTGKEREILILTELRLPVRRSEQHERSCKLKHFEILTHDAVRRVANLLWEVSSRLNILREDRDIALKRKQETALSELLDGRDVMAVLPTGFGKSRNFTVFVLARLELSASAS